MAFRPHVVIATLCLVQATDVLGVTVVVTALPSMLDDLHAPAGAATFVVTAYAMCFGGLLMLGARLGDRYGQRRVLIAALAVFGLGCLAAATAWNVPWLAAARSVQGCAAAVSVPAALSLLSTTARDEAVRRHALAAWSAAGAAAGAGGLLLGGVVTQLAGWRVIFWVLMPLSGALIYAVSVAVPAAARGPSSRPGASPAALDARGALLLTLSVIAAVLGCAQIQQRRLAVGVGLLAVAAGLAVLLVRVERAVQSPLLPAVALRDRHLRLGAAGAFVNTATTSSAITLATLSLQEARGASPLQAGVALLPFSLGVVLASSTVAAALTARRGPSGALARGLLLVAVGDAALVASPLGVWVMPVAVGIAGFGLGVSSVAATTSGTDVSAALMATASGVTNTSAQLGTALGVSLIVLVATMAASLPGGGAAWGWGVAAAMAAVSSASAHALARSSP